MCIRDSIQRIIPDPYLPHYFELYSVWSTVWPRRLHASWHCQECHWCFVMLVIDVWYARHWFLIMPAIDVCHACPWCLSGLPSMNQAYMMHGYYVVCCNIRIAILRSTSLEGNNRYSTETCLLMNSWKKYGPVISYTRMSHALYGFALIVIMSNAG